MFQVNELKKLLVLLSLVSPSTTTAAQGDFVVGIAAPMTGQYASYGEQIKRGALQAASDLNALGGLKGMKVQIETADDQCEPNRQMVIAKDLIQKRVRAVMTHFCAKSIPAIILYQDANVIQLAPLATIVEAVPANADQKLKAGMYALHAYKSVLGLRQAMDSAPSLRIDDLSLAMSNTRYLDISKAMPELVSKSELKIFRLRHNDLPCCLGD